MLADEYDEAAYAKILAAAEEIRAMARLRPAQAGAMFEQARHLFELAEQIRTDWQRRRDAEPGAWRRKLTQPIESGGDGVWLTRSAE
jgi:hypothetical protein